MILQNKYVDVSVFFMFSISINPFFTYPSWQRKSMQRFSFKFCRILITVYKDRYNDRLGIKKSARKI